MVSVVVVVVMGGASSRRPERRIDRLTHSHPNWRGWNDPRPAALRGRGEELKRDAVGGAEQQARAVAGVDDAAVRDPERLEVALPLRELVAVGAREREVVEPEATFVERLRSAVRELVEAHQRRPEEP